MTSGAATTCVRKNCAAEQDVGFAGAGAPIARTRPIGCGLWVGDAVHRNQLSRARCRMVTRIDTSDTKSALAGRGGRAQQIAPDQR
jgi:hypothetical protein